MSSFFTPPASQRKRKRVENQPVVSKKRNSSARGHRFAQSDTRPVRDDSISGSDSSEAENVYFDPDGSAQSDTSEDEVETAVEKRLRLAEQYLDNIRTEVEEDGTFDAAQIDRDLIAERLKEDVAETRGKIYRTIAGDLDLGRASHVFTKSGLQKAVTGCALRLPCAWIISKDITVEKWEIADPRRSESLNGNQPTNVTPRRTPKRLLWRRGNRHRRHDRGYLGHTGEIISVAISDSGRFLATGDTDARLIIWDAETLTPQKLFTRHRDAVTALSFRRGTEQLFSGGADRAVLVWSASEHAYIETLHGHEDKVIGVAGGLEVLQETCVSVGARDRSARLWKVVEENQLVFRSGGTARQKGMDKLRRDRFGEKPNREDTTHTIGLKSHLIRDDKPGAYTEGSMDCVALLDSGLFVTGSDNGALSLWSIFRKKPLFIEPLTHGCDPPLKPEEMSANDDAATYGRPGPWLPRYITAIATIPFADLILTASWDGWIRIWRVGPDKRTIEPVGKVGQANSMHEDFDFHESQDGTKIIQGVVNGLAVQERGERGKDGLCIVAAVGKEPRLGRWMDLKTPNGLHIFEIPRRLLRCGEVSDSTLDVEDEAVA